MIKIYTKFVPVVAKEILIQNIATKYGSWLFFDYSLLAVMQCWHHYVSWVQTG